MDRHGRCKGCISYQPCDVDEGGAEEAGMPDEVRRAIEAEWGWCARYEILVWGECEDCEECES